jgi:uncharacterized protein YbjT (DUF2867 family)
VIVVTGATGTLGRRVLRLLEDRGLNMRIVTRDRSRVPQSLSARVEVVLGDLRNASVRGAAVVGARTVIAAATGFGGASGAGPRAVDRDANVGLIEAAEAAGVEHFILLSVAGAAPEHAGELRRMKHAAEEALKRSSLDWTIVRPRPYMETFVEVIGRPLLETGGTRVFGTGDNPINFVSAADVAHVVLEAVVDGRLRGKTIEVDGPENLTLNELVQAVEKAVGRRGRVSHAPVAALRLTSVLLRPFKPGLAGRMQAAVGMATTNMAADVGRAPGWPRSHPEIRVADVIGSDLLGTC